MLHRAEGQGMQGTVQQSLEAAESIGVDLPGSENSAPVCKDDGKMQRKCTCKKSRCLKLYCECFAAGETIMHTCLQSLLCSHSPLCTDQISLQCFAGFPDLLSSCSQVSYWTMITCSESFSGVVRQFNWCSLHCRSLPLLPACSSFLSTYPTYLVLASSAHLLAGTHMPASM